MFWLLSRSNGLRREKGEARYFIDGSGGEKQGRCGQTEGKGEGHRQMQANNDYIFITVQVFI